MLYLQHAYECSDEAIVNTWVENPYVQYFTCETYFQTEVPLDSSSLTRWRKSTFSGWDHVFAEPTMIAIVDRMVHQARIFEMNVENF